MVIHRRVSVVAVLACLADNGAHRDAIFDGQAASSFGSLAGLFARDVALFNAMLRERQMGAVVVPPR